MFAGQGHVAKFALDQIQLLKDSYSFRVARAEIGESPKQPSESTLAFNKIGQGFTPPHSGRLPPGWP